MTNRFNLDDFLPFRLNRLAGEVSEQLAAIYAKKFNLDIPQWRVLATLSAGECTAQNIVSSTRTHKSTISRAVQQLEIRSLVERVVSEADKRAFVLRLTPEGDALFEELKPVVLEYEENLRAKLSQEDLRNLMKGVAACEAALGLMENSAK